MFGHLSSERMKNKRNQREWNWYSASVRNPSLSLPHFFRVKILRQSHSPFPTHPTHTPYIPSADTGWFILEVFDTFNPPRNPSDTPSLPLTRTYKILTSRKGGENYIFFTPLHSGTNRLVLIAWKNINITLKYWNVAPTLTPFDDYFNCQPPSWRV